MSSFLRKNEAFLCTMSVNRHLSSFFDILPTLYLVQIKNNWPFIISSSKKLKCTIFKLKMILWEDRNLFKIYHYNILVSKKNAHKCLYMMLCTSVHVLWQISGGQRTNFGISANLPSCLCMGLWISVVVLAHQLMCSGSFYLYFHSYHKITGTAGTPIPSFYVGSANLKGSCFLTMNTLLLSHLFCV